MRSCEVGSKRSIQYHDPIHRSSFLAFPSIQIPARPSHRNQRTLISKPRPTDVENLRSNPGSPIVLVWRGLEGEEFEALPHIQSRNAHLQVRNRYTGDGTDDPIPASTRAPWGKSCPGPHCEPWRHQDFSILIVQVVWVHGSASVIRCSLVSKVILYDSRRI